MFFENSYVNIGVENKVKTKMATNDENTQKVIEKIKSAENILVALSKNPSVDEMAAAIGLTMLLDNTGKHATAIYSGATPNALRFLKPEETFETDTNSLQDFIIALNKEKADHLRYKVEGDYVKVYITPYKTEISEKDLEFSHGDFNVDLVIGLDVKAPEELDAALSEYGRIMHDASAINITDGKPGKFADLEWNDEKASSVSEMLARMIMNMPEAMEKVEPEMATAFLTGIVAATDRFSNERTTPETMEIASELMKKGADQKLIADNIELTGETKTDEPEPKPEQAAPAESENGAQNETTEPEVATEPAEDETELKVHSDEENKEAAEAERKLEEIVQPAAEKEEPLMEQLRQVANDVKPPEYVPGDNPAATVAPSIEEKEANDIPDMNFGMTIEPPKDVSTEPVAPLAEPEVDVNPSLPLPEDINLPPPPTPPIDFNEGSPMLPQIETSESEASAEKTGEPETTAADALLPKPDGADSLGGDSDPGAFQIPGM